MNFGSTKTKLDYILENGFRRIDEAVEGVIDRHWPVTPCHNSILDNIAAKGALRSGGQADTVSVILAAQGEDPRNSALWSLLGDPLRSFAGMAAQQGPMANAYNQGVNTGLIGTDPLGNTLL